MLLIFTLSSCNDQGCIEADDFGEYQIQTLEINSNAAEDSCHYNSALNITDADQGSGVKTCFTTGVASVSDESGTVQSTVSGGCSGKQSDGTGLDAVHLNLCINNCVQSCLSGGGAGNAANPEPNWTATDERSSSQNIGLEILPGAEISITASGSVTLSNNANYPTIYIPVDGLDSTGMYPNFKNSSWSGESIFEVNAGQSLNVQFSGKWARPITTGLLTDNYYDTASVGGGSSALSGTSSINTAIYDGATTLAAYTIPHPSGYLFDSSQGTEILGTKGTPLLPNPITWTCDYAATGSSVAESLNSNCYNKTNGYQSLGYAASVDTAVLNSSNGFVIKSSDKSDSLGTYGGPIRWTKDSTINGGQDIFTNSLSKNFNVVSSSEYSIPLGSIFDANNLPLVPGKSSITVPTSGASFANNDIDPYIMYIRGACSAGSSYNSAYVTLKDSSGNSITGKTGLTVNLNSNTGWYNSQITVDPSQKIIITPISNCGTLNVTIKFQKFKDILIERSGFVRFTTLNAISGNCTLNGRIINPNDSNHNARPNTDSDFYEYDDFTTTSSTDPFNSLSVPTSSSSYSWSSTVFVRKGQIIRLSPDSWNGTFTTANNLTRECGIGMVMQLTPRPALLCKGVASSPINNVSSSCLQDIDLTTGSLVGCQAYAPECSDLSNTSYYCPYTDCQSTISCTAGSAPLYQKTSCTITSNINSSACTAALSSLSSSNQNNFKSACSNSYCGSKMLNNAQLAAKTLQTIDQCYDLENYTGTVSGINGIPVAVGSAVPDNDPMFLSKGAKRLDVFNGSYGNFQQFSSTGNKDTLPASPNGNIIYQGTNLLNFSQDSRLKFMFVTNNGDFRSLNQNYSSVKGTGSALAYSNSSQRGTGYTGNNGFKVSFSGSLQFSNGQWLEVKLCREDDSNSCRGANITYTSGLDTQPHLVELNDPSASNTNPTLSTIANYKFDGFGTLVRTTAPNSISSKDCTALNQGVGTAIGNTFYCHSYLNSTSIYLYNSNAKQAFSDSQYKELDKLRLTFKIKDPEVPTCIIPGSSSSTYNGINIANPAYQGNVCYTGSNCIPTGGSYSTSCGANNSSSSPCTGTISGSTCVTTPNSSFNGYYDTGGHCASNSGSTGQTCTSSDGVPSLTASSPCRKQFYCGNVYTNNSGKYHVTVKVANPPGNNISNIIGGVITPVIETMDGKRTIDASGNVTQTVGQSQRIYTLVVQDSRYQMILTMSMTLMLILYGITYMMGMTDLNSSDLINRCIKIALIYFFASPTGWYWFNLIVVKWFKDGTDYLAFTMASSFDDSVEITHALSINDYYDKSVLFSSVDKVFGMFFSQAVQKKISALLFASIFGWVYLWIIYLSFMLYIYAVGYAVLYYLTAQIFISILFTLGPIFFIFTLFNQTKGMFDSWVNQLIGFSLQQIFLLTTLAFFNMMMYEVLKMSLGYKICWDEVWTINIITRISLLSFWTVASLPPSVNTQAEVGDIGHPEGIPSLFSILFIWVVASLMKNFVTFMTDLGASIGGSLKASAMAKGALDTIQAAQKYSSGRFEDIAKATVGEPMKRLDAALFDSGEHAKKAREARQAKNREDQGKKESLAKAGNEAMSNYKRENAASYAALDEAGKKEALLKAKEDGMKKEAKKLGISDDDLKKLKSDKGLKYEGSNLLVAGMQAARQKAGFGGATLEKSLNDGKIDTKMSFREAQQGMKKMSTEERGKFLENAKKTDTKIDKSTSQKVIGAASKVASAATINPATKLAAGLTIGSAGTVAGAIVDTGKYVASGGADKSFTATKAALGTGASLIKGSAVDAGKAVANSSLGKLTTGTLSGTVGVAGGLVVDAATSIATGKGSLSSTRAAATFAGKSLSSVTKRVANISGISSIAQNAKDRSDAIKRLEDSGKLRKMAAGTNFLRSAEENKMIRDDIKSHHEAQQTKMPQTNDSMTIAKLEALDKGLSIEENRKENRGVLGAMSSAIAGPGGIGHAVTSQFDKQKSAADQKTRGVTAIASKLGETKGEIETANASKDALIATRDSAQQASKDIRDVQQRESELKGTAKPQSVMDRIMGKKPEMEMPTEARKEQLQKEIAGIKGASRFYQDEKTMENLRAEYSSAPDDKKADITKQMGDVTGKAGYVESEGGGLNRANAIYQESTQKLASVDVKLDKMNATTSASIKSADVFENVMNSKSTKEKERAYTDMSKTLVGRAHIATGGVFSEKARQTVKDHKYIENMKSDYAALGNTKDEDMKIDGKKEDGSKASRAHDKFSEKYAADIEPSTPIDSGSKGPLNSIAEESEEDED